MQPHSLAQEPFPRRQHPEMSLCSQCLLLTISNSNLTQRSWQVCHRLRPSYLPFYPNSIIYRWMGCRPLLLLCRLAMIAIRRPDVIKRKSVTFHFFSSPYFLNSSVISSYFYALYYYNYTHYWDFLIMIVLCCKSHNLTILGILINCLWEWFFVWIKLRWSCFEFAALLVSFRKSK